MKKQVIGVMLLTAYLTGNVGTSLAYAEEVKIEVDVEKGYEKSGWQQEDGQYYYYENNEKVTGWSHDGYDWYYLDNETGAMKTGWQNDGYDWYFLDKETGVLQTGWSYDGYDWYYLDSESGVMQTGWTFDGYDWYYLDKDNGVMQTGWYNDGYDWYYLNKDNGVMQTDWFNDGYDWYYFNEENGVMQTGRHNIDGTQYWLNDNGTMKVDQLIGTTIINVHGEVTDVTRADCSSDVQYNMFKDMTSLSNREHVHNRAIELHNGITNNNCVFFLSEVLRRSGVSIPNSIGYTTKLQAQLVSRGWKKRTDLQNLKPGDIVYAGTNRGYTHVYLFMGWADDGVAYIVDNQKSKFGSVLHKRKVFEADNVNDTDPSLNYYTYN